MMISAAENKKSSKTQFVSKDNKKQTDDAIRETAA